MSDSRNLNQAADEEMGFVDGAEVGREIGASLALSFRQRIVVYGRLGGPMDRQLVVRLSATSTCP